MKPPTLAQRILAALAESPIPCATPDLVALVATGSTSPRSRVWVTLRWLERSGLVVKAKRDYRPDRGSGHTITYWAIK